MPRRNPFEERHRRLREAELDLVFALRKLHENDLPAAYVNVCVAVVHICAAMFETEHDKVFRALDMDKPRAEELMTCTGPKL